MMGSYGQIWLLVGVALLLFKKTRKTGFTIILSYVLVLIIGHFGLKDLIARPRPCHIDQTVELLVDRPDSYSFPSTHSAWAFGAAMSIFMYYKKAGIITFVVALVMGFSRMYLFVHFPTDVLLGAIMGILLAYLSAVIVNNVSDKLNKK